jgi:hypothetical protein
MTWRWLRVKRWWRKRGLMLHRPPRTCRRCGRPAWVSMRGWNRTNKWTFCSRVCRVATYVDSQTPPPQRRIPSTSPIYVPVSEAAAPARCPHPWKLSFTDETGARHHFRDLMAKDSHLDVYLCRCLYWHAGHTPYHLRLPSRAKVTYLPLQGPLSEEHRRLLSDLAQSLETDHGQG